MKPGSVVAQFERAFGEKVGAEYVIGLANGTCTLHTALVALGVKPGDRVAVPPLTMSSTTIAVLHAGVVPVFVDVDHATWLMEAWEDRRIYTRVQYGLGVSLFGLHLPKPAPVCSDLTIDDAAQTLRPHSGCAFTSYSFQSSKILSCGEGGALVTNDRHLAQAAREFSSLGYRLDPSQPRIDSSVLKNPTYQRHHSLGWNYRMADVQAAELLRQMEYWDELLEVRQRCASLYAEAIKGCEWLTPQHVPDGWRHDYWTYAVALTNEAAYHMYHLVPPNEDCTQWELMAQLIVKHGGERPYACWLPAYQEPGLCQQLWTSEVMCPIAESLQPRLLLFQTNKIDSAMQNSRALARAIDEIS